MPLALAPDAGLLVGRWAGGQPREADGLAGRPRGCLLLGEETGGWALSLMRQELSDPFLWETFKELTAPRQDCLLIIILPDE